MEEMNKRRHMDYLRRQPIINGLRKKIEATNRSCCIKHHQTLHSNLKLHAKTKIHSLSLCCMLKMIK